MSVLKWITIFFCVLVIVFTPIGLFTHLLFAKIIAAISLLIMGISMICRLIIIRKTNSKNK